MTSTSFPKPLIVQGDQTMLLEVDNPLFEEARGEIGPFSELEKSPEHIHTYKLTPLSLWNAASAGWTPDQVLQSMERFSRYGIPESIVFNVKEVMSRFGVLKLYGTAEPDTLWLTTTHNRVYREIEAFKRLQKYLVPTLHEGEKGFTLNLMHRGTIKQELIHLGFPVQDMAPLKEGDPLDIPLAEALDDGTLLTIRDYQREAVDSVLGNRGPGTGYGTVVLPCGSGKTVVGLALMNKLATHTLILTTNVAAVHQWREELLEKTGLTADQIGEYTGDTKNIRPVTIGTYQVLVWRKDKTSEYNHFKIFREHNWGLIIYDEVHLLPAPVFRVTAELQAVRRLGLTATLVREDGAEADVFSLVGPKKYDVPWKQLEAKGWIAKAFCHEVRIDLPDDQKIPYAVANMKDKFRIASVNPLKELIVLQLIENHREDSILVIGQYLEQLDSIAKRLGAPIITGKTPNPQRELIYNDFRRGKIHVLVVSKVANFAINLPDASVAIQISGTFGSRQEEAQRLGRILRPKEKNSYFYSVISRFTNEEEYAVNRQKFLTEQGYKYTIDIYDPQEVAP